MYAKDSQKETIRQVFMNTNAPKMTARHITLIRLLKVTWVPLENGAPGIHFTNPLGKQGNTDTINTAMAALGISDELLVIQTLAEVGRLLPEYVSQSVHLKPGKYAIPMDSLAYFNNPSSGVGKDGFFEFRTEHSVLLKAAHWRWVDADTVDEVLNDELWPMPYIDGKRPYGDCSYYQIDMGRLLGEPYALDSNGNAIHDAEKDARLERLHIETLAALQVFLVYAETLAAS